MQLGRFRLGTVVEKTHGSASRQLSTDPHTHIGHVTGFDLNNSNEVIILVKWADGEEYSIHPGNIEVLGE